MTKPLPTVTLDVFHLFSDAQWKAVVTATNSALPLNRFRREIEWSLYFFTQKHAPFGFEYVGIPFDPNNPPASYQYQLVDMVAAHRRLAKAAREMVAAYDDFLHPAWGEDCERWEKALPDFENFIENLESIARLSDEQASQIEAEKSQEAGSLKEFFAEFNPPRGRRNSKIAVLVEDLILIWMQAGGLVGASKSGGGGGPLVRFISAVTQCVLDERPSVPTVQAWIRSFKADFNEGRFFRPGRRDRWLDANRGADRT